MPTFFPLFCAALQACLLNLKAMRRTVRPESLRMRRRHRLFEKTVSVFPGKFTTLLRFCHVSFPEHAKASLQIFLCLRPFCFLCFYFDCFSVNMSRGIKRYFCKSSSSSPLSDFAVRLFKQELFGKRNMESFSYVPEIIRRNRLKLPWHNGINFNQNFRRFLHRM